MFRIKSLVLITTGIVVAIVVSLAPGANDEPVDQNGSWLSPPVMLPHPDFPSLPSIDSRPFHGPVGHWGVDHVIRDDEPVIPKRPYPRWIPKPSTGPWLFWGVIPEYEHP